MPLPAMSPTRRRLLALMVAVWSLALLPGGAGGADFEDSFETPQATWSIGETDVTHRVISHGRTTDGPHRGRQAERIILDAGSGTMIRLDLPLTPSRVIDEWRRCGPTAQGR